MRGNLTKSLMRLKNLKEARVAGKRVLVRVDFNVLPLKPKEPRILKTLPTIKYLLRKGAKVILATHLETNDGKIPSARVLLSYLKKYLPGVKFEEPARVSLLENLRKNPGEKKNSLNFAKKLAASADIYVNEAFSVSHRPHASIVLLPKLLPSFAGFLFKEELKNLSKVFSPPHPFTLIVGGEKAETKLPLIKELLSKADAVFLGGIPAVVFLKKPLIKSRKIILPEKVIRKNGKILDIAPGAVAKWEKIIAKSRLVVWNGPFGYVERGYTDGTQKLISVLRKAPGKIIIGGGDTLDCLPRGFAEKPPKNVFISTGGGAMLEYLAERTLPGIAALEKGRASPKRREALKN